MFWRKDKIEIDIKDTLGLDIAREYRMAKTSDPLMQNSILTALKMVSVIPQNREDITPIVREELRSLIRDQKTSANGSGSLIVAVGAGYSSYKNWEMAEAPIQALNDRIGFVPAGWRMDALSGLRYWIASLVGEPAPVRACMADIFTLSSTMAWDASIKIESIIGKYAVGLPYGLQAIIVEAMIEGIRKSTIHMSPILQKAADLAENGYANGMSLNLWPSIIKLSNTTYNYYDTFALLSKSHGLAGIDELGIDIENAVEIHVSIEDELKFLRDSTIEFGKEYVLMCEEAGYDDLLERHSYIFSSIFLV